MPAPDNSQPSFSSSRRWLLRLNFIVAIVALLALLVMCNYLAGGYYKRFFVADYSVTRLSPQTLRILDTLTNDVAITIFFDVEEEAELYNLTSGLLAEYQNANPKHIVVKTLDYTRFDSQARALLTRHSLSGLEKKNFVLFESNGHSKIFYSKSLADYDIAAVLSGESKTFRRSTFRGEMLFTSAIFAVSNPRPLKAYFLGGHGEHSLESNTAGESYSKLAAMLKDELDTQWQSLSLLGTNTVPGDCQLLIIAGPLTSRFLPSESERIDDYLKKGGRLLLLLNNHFHSGIESTLANWGVGAGDDPVHEQDKNYILTSDTDFVAAQYPQPHPILNTIVSEKPPGVIRFFSPRPFKVNSTNSTPGAPEVTVLAASSDQSVCGGLKGSFPLIVAVEQGVIKGVNTPRGGTRIVAVGDSYLFCDAVIDSGAANHTFIGMALNWLMERPDILLGDLVPRPIKEYRLLITSSQMTSVQLLFLAGLPGFVLLVGGMVWLRRRR